jgi:uncharacterized Rmd1/YagE family protein
MKDKLINECLSILKRDDIKNELKTLSLPVIDICFDLLKPYLYGIMLFIIIIFIMLFIILRLLLQLNKYL